MIVKKRFLILAMTIALMLSLAACGSSTPSGEDTTQDGTDTPLQAENGEDEPAPTPTPTPTPTPKPTPSPTPRVVDESLLEDLGNEISKYQRIRKGSFWAWDSSTMKAGVDIPGVFGGEEYLMDGVYVYELGPDGKNFDDLSMSDGDLFLGAVTVIDEMMEGKGYIFARSPEEFSSMEGGVFFQTYNWTEEGAIMSAYLLFMP